MVCQLQVVMTWKRRLQDLMILPRWNIGDPRLTLTFRYDWFQSSILVYLGSVFLNYRFHISMKNHFPEFIFKQIQMLILNLKKYRYSFGLKKNKKIMRELQYGQAHVLCSSVHYGPVLGCCGLRIGPQWYFATPLIAPISPNYLSLSSVENSISSDSNICMKL